MSKWPFEQKKPSSHLVVFREIPFWNIQLQKPDLKLCIVPVYLAVNT